MRRLARTTAGAFLFLLAVGLSLPGVQVVRAETPAQSEADAPMCREPGGPPASLKVQQMRALLAARAASAEGAAPSDVVNLSTTGHGYRGTNRIDLAPIERELDSPHRR